MKDCQTSFRERDDSLLTMLTVATRNRNVLWRYIGDGRYMSYSPEDFGGMFRVLRGDGACLPKFWFAVNCELVELHPTRGLLKYLADSIITQLSQVDRAMAEAMGKLDKL